MACSIYGIVNSANTEANRLLLQKIGQAESIGNNFKSLESSDGRILLATNESSVSYAQIDKLRVAVYGEIFNLGNLSLSSCISSENQAEIIAQLYQKNGIDFVRKLNGSFLIAVYDERMSKFFLIRDNLGKKTLFYYINDKQELFFADRISAIRAADDLEINESAISEYLSLQAIYGTKTIYKDVFKLLPASVLELDLRNVSYKIFRYYKADLVTKSNLNFKDSQTELFNKVCQAVNRRLQFNNSDNIGVFLSGGIDSSIVASLTACLSSQKEIHAFTIGFENQVYDESAAASATAKFLNRKYGNKIIHHIRKIEADDFSLLGEIGRNYGEVFADASMIPTWHLSAFAKELVPIVLSGDGGDEFFAGYNRYIVMKYLEFINKIPLKLRRTFLGQLIKMFPSDNERGIGNKLCRLSQVAMQENLSRQYQRIFDRATTNLKSRICNFSISESENIFDEFVDARAENIVEKCQEFDQNHYIWSDVLTKVDVAAAANSLIIRSPLLDSDVIQFANSLPVNYKLKSRNKKYILKETFAEFLPFELLAGTKKGFALPLGEFLCGKWNKPMKERLLENRLIQSNLFNRSELAKLLETNRSIEQNCHLILSLIMLDFFLENQ
ncbi:MAG: hypothetical protein IJW31_10170 [Lentisphaeria bacterium]|nr:hypothetical protein [Lentisphaeria bacterium]